jgi:hypothetical protein
MIFPVLNYERRLQIGDKTRLNASKCFIAPVTETPISSVTIKPGANATPLSVYSINSQDDWYLDWVFNDQLFDVVAGYNDKIDFLQDLKKVATLTPGTYTRAQLMTAVATAMTNAPDSLGTFSVTSDTSDRLTISNDSNRFQLLPVSGDNEAASLLKHIGFTKDTDGTSIKGAPVEYSLRQITLTIGNGTLSESVVEYVRLYSEKGDALFSDDQDLLVWEPMITQWVEQGRSSFLNIHREAQDQIMYYLDKQGFTNIYGQKYNKFDILDVSEVNEWSAFLALSIIMWGISNKQDDVFLARYREYQGKARDARDRAILRIDTNRDGTLDVGESIDIVSGVVVTR